MRPMITLLTCLVVLWCGNGWAGPLQTGGTGPKKNLKIPTLLSAEQQSTPAQISFSSEAIDDNSMLFERKKPLDRLLAAADSEKKPSPEVSEADQSARKTDSKRWSSFLPLMAEEAYKRGYELPLPFGVSANFVLLNREIDIKGVKAGINSPPDDISSVVTVEAETSVVVPTLRFDTWLLPFLNLYVFGGHIEESSDITLTLTIPPLLPGGPTREATLNATGDLDGTVFGAGTTLAGGYKDFFLALDVNYAKSDLGGIFDHTIDALLYSLRTGWRGRVGNSMTSLWVGGTYWDSESTISGSLPLGGGNVINFEVLQGPKNPYNMNLGLNIEIRRAFQMVVDYGFNFDDLQMLVLSFAYRF
ncbi:hypothetical protein ACFL9U_05925 [Thermodesulfobacteriota bacterium]